MDVREKLVELLREFIEVDVWDNGEFIEKEIDFSKIAENLLENGVTVQEWISVDDRLPDPPDRAICLDEDGNMILGTYTEWGWLFPCYFAEPTHWMPLPQPPKGE